MSEQADQAPGRRLTRGMLEQRGGSWWNRYTEETVDPSTGIISRRATRMKLGVLSDLRSRAAASEALDRYIALQSAGSLQPGATIKFRQYAARFDRLRISLTRTQTRRAYRSILKNHVLPAFGHLPLSSVDATELQQLVVRLHEKGLARGTIENVRNRALEILKHARSAGFACHTIVRREIKLPSESKPDREHRHFTETEIDTLLEASLGEKRVLWALMADGALRISEALALEARHIDLGAGVILVRQAVSSGMVVPLKTRTAKRDVPLLPRLAKILTEWRAAPATGLLFPTRTGRPQRADDIRKRWLKPLLDRLAIPPGRSCHAFRHSCPGRLDALGLSPASIQKWMGHSRLEMTERYLHRSTADLREQLSAALKRAGATSAETRKTRPSITAEPAIQGIPELPRSTPEIQGMDRERA